MSYITRFSPVLAALLPVLFLSHSAVALQGSCDQGPVQCTTGSPIALPAQVASTNASPFPVDASVFLDRYSGAVPLVGVLIEIQLSRTGEVQYTNQSAANCLLVSWDHVTNLSLGSPTNPVLCQDLPLNLNLFSSGTFMNVPPGANAVASLTMDGLCDACPSGPAVRIGPLTDPTLLLSLSGAGQIQFRMTGSLTGSVMGCSPGTSLLDAEAELRVSVRYLVCPMSTYCFGSGCPCNNDDPAAGCANSSGGVGAFLSGFGTPSVGSDSAQLIVVQSEGGRPGLFFQGDNAHGGGNGIPFGDGLRCAAGSVVRLQVVSAGATGTAISTVGLAAKGGVVPGDLRRYQWWYRDPSTSVCGAGFNLSNGLEISWLP